MEDHGITHWRRRHAIPRRHHTPSRTVESLVLSNVPAERPERHLCSCPHRARTSDARVACAYMLGGGRPRQEAERIRRGQGRGSDQSRAGHVRPRITWHASMHRRWACLQVHHSES